MIFAFENVKLFKAPGSQVKNIPQAPRNTEKVFGKWRQRLARYFNGFIKSHVSKRLFFAQENVMEMYVSDSAYEQ